MTNTLFAHVRVHVQYSICYITFLAFMFPSSSMKIINFFLVFWLTFYTEQQVITDVSLEHRESESGRLCYWFTSTHY
jgi:hypothetical protein